MNEIVVSQKEVEEKAFPYESLQACESAFIDMRIPGHEGKKNYSIIGGGVTQSSRQFVNCYEAHGYNIGAVSLPVNHINGLHSHFTAEVFIVESGVWEIFWGPEGEHKVIVNPLSIISIPTGVFRGFRCIEEGFILTSLGGDDTGGVVWHPEVIETGNQHGVHLMANNMIVDRAGGENFPEGVAQMTLLNAAEIGAMRKVSPEEMSGRVSIVSQADFSERALLDNCLEGHRTGMAPVIGWGLTMDKTHVPPIKNPHTFTLEWLRIPPHHSVSCHRIEESQVVLVLAGELTLRYNKKDAPQRPSVKLANRGSASVPRCAWREFVNEGDREVIAVLVCGLDGRKSIEWAEDVVEAAWTHGWAVDPGGYIEDAHLMRYCAKS